MEEDKMDDYESHESEKLPDEDELLQYLNELQTSIREFKEAITGEILKKGQLVKKSTWVNSKDAAGFLQVTGRTLATYRKRRLIPYRKLFKTCLYNYNDLLEFRNSLNRK